MKTLVVVLSVLVTLVASKFITDKHGSFLRSNSAFGYLTEVGQPLATKIRKAEQALNSGEGWQQINGTSAITPTLKIVHGSAAHAGEFPYQAGIIITMKTSDVPSYCGGTLINSKRVLTAGHCWWDGRNQAISYTIVLGSIKLFSGGLRINTSEVIAHSKWDPIPTINDLAMAYLPTPVDFSNTIKPITLPSGRVLKETFEGETVIITGYGRIADDSRVSQTSYLSYAAMQVISNARCSRQYRDLWATNICAQGRNHQGTCTGDSGGPLALTRNKKVILIGVISFGGKSCETGQPIGFTRITSFVDWINTHL